MTYKQIEASRNARLWIVQVAIPVMSMAVTTLSIPEVRQTVAAKAKLVKYSTEYKIENIKNKLKKES